MPLYSDFLDSIAADNLPPAVLTAEDRDARASARMLGLVLLYVAAWCVAIATVVACLIIL